MTPEGSKTRVQLVHSGLPDDAISDHTMGWNHYLGRLAIVAAGGEVGPDVAPSDGDSSEGSMSNAAATTLDNAQLWEMIHAERARAVSLLERLTLEQWRQPSLCQGWSVHVAAAHLMASGEQTMPNFLVGLVRHGFRFNVMIDTDARRLGQLPRDEIIERLRARTTTTNRPPAPVVAMLGEVVVHSNDIRFALGIPDDTATASSVACLNHFVTSNFPVPAKTTTEGLELIATDADWRHGSGREVRGPVQALLLAIAGRTLATSALAGDGVETLAAGIA